MRQPTGPEWATICDLFDALIELPPADREPRLQRAGVDPFVADQVRTLLRAGDSRGLLDGLAPPPPAAAEYASLAPGTMVGAFRIVRLIGRGGMGEVYLAERAASGFEQKVALKLLRPEAAGRTALFDTERSLLATLEHPGIARLIDGGIAADGRPFMALEYVEGEEIGAWCAAHAATPDTRLQLFLEICDAVAYAHARLVVHRDLKPANILIDGDGRTRLLDFGIARIVDEGTADRTMTQAPLTPDYAAPEQLENAPTTVATDIYALGAVLFELLTGAGPWRRGDNSLPSVVRRILQEDPPPPSRIAAERGGPVPAPRIAGDLDAVVLKAMRRAPAERYANVADLAADLRRYLDHRPVQARAGSGGYRLRRFVRRNRWGVVAGAALAVALLAGASGIAWQARQTARERDIARAELRRSEAAFNAMTFLFRNASEAGRIQSVTARDMLNASARNLIATLQPGSSDAADAAIAIADLYIVTDDPAGGEAFLRQAMKAGIGAGDPIAKAQIQQRLGQVYAAMNRPDEARRLLDAAAQVWQRDPARFRIERQELIGARAHMLRVAGDRDSAIQLLQTSLPEAEAVLADNPRELVTRYANLALHLIEANRVAEADEILTRGEAAVARLGAERTAPALLLMQLRAAWLTRRNDYRAAVQAFRHTVAIRRELYGPSAALATDLLQLGRTLQILGRSRDALAALDEAELLARTHIGAGAGPTLMIGLSRGEALASLGRTDEAAEALAAVEPGMRAAGTASLQYGAFLRARAQLRLNQGRLAAASSDLDAADTIFAELGPAGEAFRTGVAALRARIAEAGG